MWWENKLMRTFRCRLQQNPGVLGHLLASLNPDHMQKMIQVVDEDPDAELLEVRDEVMEMHQGGKIDIRSRYQINDLSRLRRVYTPGVAEVCLKIQKDPSLAHRFTSIPHFVAIVTDGSAVLGLGEIGPQAAMPIMEGKASLMETLACIYLGLKCWVQTSIRML